jgi:hypothetical protein
MHRTGPAARTGRTATGKRFGATLAALVAASAVMLSVAAPAQAATAVKIARIYYNSPGTDDRSTASLDAEYVSLQNLTTRTQVITGWTIRDAAGHAYTFPATSIPAGKVLVLRTGKGMNTSTTRYWQQGNYIWNNDRDTGYLRNSAGTLVYTCSYNSTAVSYKNC